MNTYSSYFIMVFFASSVLFLLVIVGIATGLGLQDVNTARLSQAVNSVNCIISFYYGWKLLPGVAPRHMLKQGENILLQGFKQNWNTAMRINRFYKRSLRWFLLGIVFAEAAANAFTVVSVVFLNDQLKMSSSQIGIFFLIVLIAIVPGGKVSEYVTAKTDPNKSIRLSILALFIVSVIGAPLLNKDNVFPWAYIWGVIVGVLLGWYYQVEQLLLSLTIPTGQEGELSGFFVYCSQILAWLPPLVFSVLVENDVDQAVGIIAVSAFCLVAVAIFSLCAPWDELLDEVHNNELHREYVKALEAQEEIIVHGEDDEDNTSFKDAPEETQQDESGEQ